MYNLGTLMMKDGSVELYVEIVVEAKTIKNNETALLTMQRKSANVLDGISAQTFSRTGDGNAAAAIKRVPGVSIEGGKHVFVRGLGDRYTKTLLNGMGIPGLDPDKNSVQMDIFPTNLLDNIVVYKTFTPDLPGDFTGGTVDVSTKDFPEEETFKASVGLGVNPTMHFQNDFRTFEGGKLDFLGFDDGTRALGFHEKFQIPSEVTSRSNVGMANKLNELTRSFNPEMATSQKTNFMNHSYAISYGNQINKDKATFGYTVAMNYKASSNHFKDATISQYIKSDILSETALEVARLDDAVISQEGVLWSGLASGAVKFQKSKIRFGVFHSQNATDIASNVITENGDENPATLVKDNLETIIRRVTNTYVGGEHTIGKKKLKLDWTVSPTFSNVDEPDNRYTAYEYIEEEDTYLLSRSVGGEVARVYRNLDEMNLSSKIDLTYNFDAFKRDAKLKFGLANNYKEREYGINDYGIYFNGDRELSGNANEFLSPETIWTQDNITGTSFVRGDFQPSNTYAATQNVNALYAMTELQLLEKLKLIGGFRVEQFQNWYTGQNALGNELYVDEKVLDKINVLPSVNLVYNLNDKMNLRGSYSMTVARPSFKEKSVAQIQDRLSGGYFYGNIDILPSTISNMDLRWEYFFEKGEVVSVSAFTKLINDPIEMAAYKVGNIYRSDIITPENGGNAILYGLELEVRKNFGFISEAMKNLSIGTNFSYVKSQVKMTDEEFEIRENWARTGEDVKDTRTLVGTAPYTTNVYLNYRSSKIGTEANLSYNVQGERLAVLGLGEVPDVYETPFHSLNFKVSQFLGKADKLKASFGVNNILGSKRKNVYRSFGTDDVTARYRNPGTGFSLGISYQFK